MDTADLSLPSSVVSDIFADTDNDNLFDLVEGLYDDEVLSLID